MNFVVDQRLWIIIDNWRFAQVIMRPSYEEQLVFWECKNWPMAIIPRWRSYKETFYRESSRECLNWRSYEGGALIKVADSAISTVYFQKIKQDSSDPSG